MPPTYMFGMAGIAIGLIAAIGTFIFEQIREERDRQRCVEDTARVLELVLSEGWDQQRYREQEQNRGNKSRTPTKKRTQTTADCVFCKKPLAGQTILRLRDCQHVYHERCFSVLTQFEERCVLQGCNAVLEG